MAPEPIRNVVEVDARPDPLAFFVRVSAGCAQRLSLQRLGAFQAGALDMPGLPGMHWPCRGMDFMDTSDPVERARIYTRQFDGLRSMRLMRVAGDPPEWALMTALRPDILIQDTAYSLPMLYVSRTGQIGGTTCRISTLNDAAADALEQALVTFDAATHRFRALSSVLLAAEELMVWDGCYRAERDTGASWIWTGASRTARFLLPAIDGRVWRLTVFLYGNHTPLTPDGLAIRIGKTLVPTHFYSEYQKLEADFPAVVSAPCVLVSLHHGSLGTTEDGSRALGLAIHKVRLEALD